MPVHYLDTSALVKRYIPEVGSTWVMDLCTNESVTTSMLTITELASALARRTFEGQLHRHQRDAVNARFLDDMRDMSVIRLSGPVVREAARLILACPPTVRLRSLDALHLASARAAFTTARRRGLDVGSFVSSDHALLAAAQWANLSVANPEDVP